VAQHAARPARAIGALASERCGDGLLHVVFPAWVLMVSRGCPSGPLAPGPAAAHWPIAPQRAAWHHADVRSRIVVPLCFVTYERLRTRAPAGPRAITALSTRRERARRPPARPPQRGQHGSDHLKRDGGGRRPPFSDPAASGSDSADERRPRRRRGWRGRRVVGQRRRRRERRGRRLPWEAAGRALATGGAVLTPARRRRAATGREAEDGADVPPRRRDGRRADLSAEETILLAPPSCQHR